MTTLLSVLLYLNVVSVSGIYTTADINNYATTYSVQVNQVENDPVLLNAVILEYEPEAIIIADDLAG